ncbi:SsrA-binding protein SmpB [Candidatus Dojkabacteria bacterium]|nr:SsrA-binding protein SmpB [Candidatus Dojkabacteria bacterium]
MKSTIANNRKALFNYEIIKEYEAGISLKGWEVKSIKKADISLKESHIDFQKGELFIYNFYVKPWEFASDLSESSSTQPRKLLLRKPELSQLFGKKQQKGYTIVPLDIHLTRGFIKIRIALAKGLTKGDKRSKLKEKEQKREIERDLKSIGY